jgi:hypothetical protein
MRSTWHVDYIIGHGEATKVEIYGAFSIKKMQTANEN